MEAPGQTIKDLRSEWLCILNRLQEENLALKQRVAEASKNAGGKGEMLETLEYFLNRILNKDIHFILFRQDIGKQERLAMHPDASPDIEQEQQKLKWDLRKMDLELRKLKEEFEARICLLSGDDTNSALSPISFHSGL
jgi:hypothetical protein